MWRAGRSPELWLVERAHEEGMVDALDGSDLACDVGGDDAHSVLGRDVLHCGRQSVGARGVLDDLMGAVKAGQERTLCKLDRNGLVLKRTIEHRDYRRAAGPVLGVGGITYPGQVPSVLDEHVLKAASGTDQGDAAFARFAHDGVCRLGIAVWAARPDDHGRRGADHLGWIMNRIGGHGADVNGDPPSFRCVFDGGEGREVVAMARREVDQDRHDDCAHQKTLAAQLRCSGGALLLRDSAQGLNNLG
jgi:hypothetical protein